MVKSKKRKPILKFRPKKSPKHLPKATKKSAETAKRKTNATPHAEAARYPRSADVHPKSKQGQTTIDKSQLLDAHAQTNAALNSLGAIKSQSGVDLTEKVKEL